MKCEIGNIYLYDCRLNKTIRAVSKYNTLESFDLSPFVYPVDESKCRVVLNWRAVISEISTDLEIIHCDAEQEVLLIFDNSPDYGFMSDVILLSYKNLEEKMKENDDRLREYHFNEFDATLVADRILSACRSQM
jgi:hypothetical protein